MNRHLPLLLALCVVLPSAARAHCGKCGMGGDHPAAPAGAPAGSPVEAPKAAPGSGSSPKSAFRPLGQQTISGAPASLDAARKKFASTVEGYVSSRAEEGVWEMKDETGKARRLAFVSADQKSVVETGPGRYTGTANFKEGRRAVAVQMTVEAGQFWKVVDTRFAPPSQKKN